MSVATSLIEDQPARIVPTPAETLYQSMNHRCWPVKTSRNPMPAATRDAFPLR